MNAYKHNMKTTIKIFTCLALFSSMGIKMQAQVGIGIANPHPRAILDMTNTDNKRVVMPRSSVMPTTATTDTVGMLIYYNNGLYLRDSNAFNHVNPWKYKYDGKTQEAISFNPAGLIGVGIGINLGTPTTPNMLGYLHVSSTGKDVLATSNSAALFIGNTTAGSHMTFDADEIMVKSGPSTGGVLKLQEGKGSVKIGENSSATSNTDSTVSYLHTQIGSLSFDRSLTVYGNTNVVGKVKESGNELLPAGSIILWYGSIANIPAGWKICDGTTYTKINGGTIVSPNLSGRTVIGYGNNGGNNYTSIGPNGADSVQLTYKNLPQHQHVGRTNTDGGHVHNNQESGKADNDDNDGVGYYVGGRGGSFNNDQGGSGFVTADGSAHYHDFTTKDAANNGCVGCDAEYVDTRSAYYVLAYIIKL